MDHNLALEGYCALNALIEEDPKWRGASVHDILLELGRRWDDARQAGKKFDRWEREAERDARE